MNLEFILPPLGENVESGDIVKVLVAEGDTIEQDQPILEIETDKAVVEVPSNVAGIVREILVETGDAVSPGQIILKVDADSTEIPSPESDETVVETKEPSTPPVSPAVEKQPEADSPADQPLSTVVDTTFILPNLGENIDSGEIVSILVAVGDDITDGQSILEIETDKAVVEVPSTVSGEVREILVKVGDSVSPGEGILVIAASEPATETSVKPPAPVPTPSSEKAEVAEAEPIVADEVSSPAPAPEPPQIQKPQPEGTLKLVPAAPSVRRFAREIGIDISSVVGTGPGGRISIKNVKDFARRQHKEPQTVPTVASPQVVVEGETVSQPKPLPDFSKWGEIDRQPMSNVRRVTAERLSDAWQAPHVTQFDKADITELEQLRKRYASYAEAEGAKLTITAILVKFVTAALKKFPQFNASIDMARREIIYKKYYHIGIAVDTERGLLVPVIRDADKKSIIELAVGLTELSDRARNRKTSLEEMQGGTFTITNLGGIGGTNFTPIINAPEVAILGVSRGRFEQVYDRGTEQFEPRLMLPLSLSYDHRLVDGADGARFIRWLVDALENPFLLTLEG